MKELYSAMRTAYCLGKLVTHSVHLPWRQPALRQSRVPGLRIALFTAMLVGAACQSTGSAASILRLSGVVEATQVNVVSEVSGRITSITADEGGNVVEGEMLVQIDDASLAVQVKQAQAAVNAAEANLAQVKAGARQEDIDAAQAALRQAQADRNGARQTLTDTMAIRNNPQPINAQIDQARMGVTLAEQNLAAAQSQLAEARWWRDFYESDKSKHDTLDRQIAIAQRNVEAAQAKLDGARAQRKALEAMRSAPVTLKAQVNSARSTYSMTLASVAVAEAALAELQAGPLPEDVAQAEAKLHQAQAQLELAQATYARATLRSPLTGVVASRSAQVGETIQAGIALMTVMNLDEVRLVIYVPQTDLPRLHIGVPVKVSVDAYPGEVFTGPITTIAQQAQFSSRDTQAAEDRANVVFAVKVRLSNADHRLKAGMTADAVIDLK